MLSSLYTKQKVLTIESTVIFRNLHVYLHFVGQAASQTVRTGELHKAIMYSIQFTKLIPKNNQ